MHLLLLQLAVATAGDQLVHHGRQQQIDLVVPRLEATVTLDGRLDEGAWRQAALLTGFSSYRPADGRPAPDSTEILLWRTDDAIHVGVRAFEPHGAEAVRATLAERDRLSGDDVVELHFDSFHELKRAFVFVVNPLGVQADGTKSEGGSFLPGSAGPGETDYNPDFLWESKGRLTDSGYEVEVRIPFTSLRYPHGGGGTWGFNAVRVIRHSGWETTWTPVRRAAASFIAQGGRLQGLRGLRRGTVVEAIPELRMRVAGAPGEAGDWRYTDRQEAGANVRWAVTSNYTLNATVKPDFSQVETDATQIASDPRFALFYPEKRPFFVDAIEQFNTPNSLVYTRRIVEPIGAAKLTGKLGGTDVAVLAAVDADEPLRAGTARPGVGIVRLTQAIGAQSTAGLVYTDRTEGDDYNRVVGADARIVFGRLYFAQLQAVASATREGAASLGGPLWNAVLDRTGRQWGFNYSLIGVDPEFRTRLGFVNRTNYVRPSFMNRFSWYGAPGARLEGWTVFARVEGTWRYDDFFDGANVLEDQLSANNSFTLRGGWNLGVTPRLSRYRFDPAAYGRVVVIDGGATRALAIAPRRTAPGLGLSASTPRWRRFSASASTTLGRDVAFAEMSLARRTDASASVTWRPTERARVDASWLSSRLARAIGGETTAQVRIPRVKAEYQVTRPLFVRVVAQYEARSVGAARDWQSGLPLGVASTGGAQPIGARRSNDLRADWLVSYRPNPGTVLFVGYGSTMTEPDPLALRGLERTRDGLFIKGSYLLRLRSE